MVKIDECFPVVSRKRARLRGISETGREEVPSYQYSEQSLIARQLWLERRANYLVLLVFSGCGGCMEHCDGADPRHPCSCRSCHATITWQMSAHLRYCRGMASQKTRYSCLVKRRGVLAWQGAFQLALDLETSPLARRHPALESGTHVQARRLDRLPRCLVDYPR